MIAALLAGALLASLGLQLVVLSDVVAGDAGAITRHHRDFFSLYVARRGSGNPTAPNACSEPTPCWRKCCPPAYGARAQHGFSDVVFTAWLWRIPWGGQLTLNRRPSPGWPAL